MSIEYVGCGSHCPFLRVNIILCTFFFFFFTIVHLECLCPPKKAEPNHQDYKPELELDMKLLPSTRNW